MSEPTTAEIADAIRTCAAFADPRSARRCIEAADRLAELDAEVLKRRNDFAALMVTYTALWDEKQAIDALLPPCPTCDGTGVADCASCDGTAMASPSILCGQCNGDGFFNCWDCVDGKVTIEQLASTYNAVWSDVDLPWGVASVEWLRSVKP